MHNHEGMHLLEQGCNTCTLPCMLPIVGQFSLPSERYRIRFIPRHTRQPLHEAAKYPIVIIDTYSSRPDANFEQFRWLYIVTLSNLLKWAKIRFCPTTHYRTLWSVLTTIARYLKFGIIESKKSLYNPLRTIREDLSRKVFL